jgi:hypothetical protein
MKLLCANVAILSSILLSATICNASALGHFFERVRIDKQIPIMQSLPFTKQDNPAPGSDENVILSDVIPSSRNVNVFAGFTRDIQSIAERLSDQSQNTTVLAPLNSAVTSLPRKPWEDPQEYAVHGEEAYEGPDGEDRAHRNLRRFVEAHIVGQSPWKEGEKMQTVLGSTIWWEEKNGKRTVCVSLNLLLKQTNG